LQWHTPPFVPPQRWPICFPPQTNAWACCWMQQATSAALPGPGWCGCAARQPSHPCPLGGACGLPARRPASVFLAFGAWSKPLHFAALCPPCSPCLVGRSKSRSWTDPRACPNPVHPPAHRQQTFVCASPSLGGADRPLTGSWFCAPPHSAAAATMLLAACTLPSLSWPIHCPPACMPLGLDSLLGGRELCLPCRLGCQACGLPVAALTALLLSPANLCCWQGAVNS